jgi:23S rRNA (adenine1618-N6)-methyltransferase
MHPRNPHGSRYNFEELIAISPELSQYRFTTKHGEESIDFTDPRAVKALNRALLNKFYGISKWDIPDGFLCPPIPGRADLIHTLADLFKNPQQPLRGLDIGVGANAIYPLIGFKTFGWTFVGSDIDKTALASAQKIIEQNSLTDFIELRHQASSRNIFKNIIKESESFDFTLSNPPFHASQEEADRGNARKWKNLGRNAGLNFGGKRNELITEGGEKTFILTMINQSQEFHQNVHWFTTLVSKDTTLPLLTKRLEQLPVTNTRILEMNQGQKKSRLLAWTYKPGA